MGAKETVAQFLELSRHRDKRSAELLHPDVDYTMSLPTIRGKRNVLRFMRAFGTSISCTSTRLGRMVTPC